MNYAAAVGQTWKHHDVEASARDRTILVRYATLAASSHNTQPWKFRLDPQGIAILPDFSRRCPAVDPDDHHLYASLGCAAGNLLEAARAAGLQGHCRYDLSTSGVTVDLGKSTPARSALFEAIPRRQCSRCAFDGAAIPAAQLRLLEEAGRGDGVSLLFLAGRPQKEQVAEYVAAGNRAQFADPAWNAELRSWVRFNARSAMRTGDGLYGPVMGSPDVPQWLGRLFMQVGFSSRRQNRKDVAHIRSSSIIVALCSERDDRPHWVEAGRCYQRLALQATALGLCSAFINQPVEVPALRQQFAGFLGIGTKRPDLLVRIGRGPAMPRSLRRPVACVLA